MPLKLDREMGGIPRISLTGKDPGSSVMFVDKLSHDATQIDFTPRMRPCRRFPNGSIRIKWMPPAL
jgi:hypothetical protein